MPKGLVLGPILFAVYCGLETVLLVSESIGLGLEFCGLVRGLLLIFCSRRDKFEIYWLKYVTIYLLFADRL